MADSLSTLEARRARTQLQISRLGDMRSGSITSTGGRCGNQGCRCHQPGDPGHGPFYRLTRKVNGKSVTETFSTPTALRKAQREVEEFHRFRQLSHDLLKVNEKICKLRPVEDTLTPKQKKRRKRSSRKLPKKKPNPADW
jgi:hypothetical protein